MFFLVFVVLFVWAVVYGFRRVIRNMRVAESEPQRRKWRGAFYAMIVGLVLVAAIVGTSAYYGLKSTPKFVLLSEQPDSTLVGTAAYLSSQGKQNCVHVVAASGTPDKELKCFDSSPDQLTWRADGRLEVTAYGKADDQVHHWRKLVDAVTGAVEDVPSADVPTAAPPPITENPPGPGGEIISSISKRGTLKVTMTTKTGKRVLLSASAPTTYNIGYTVWNGDGKWFVAKDDLDQILLITTADPSTTRILAKHGFGAAVTDKNLLVPS